MEDLILFPAIDLKDGNCVRLYKGEMDSATSFNDNPSDQAKKFESQGFSWLHLVDLNGAFEGYSVNKSAIENIRKSINLPIQLGGGIRTIKHIESWINIGINRIILGTIAVKKPDIVKTACKEFPGKIAVGIDARSGMVATDGWAEQSDIPAKELVKHFEDCGVTTIIYTDIDRDGALEGINIDQTADFASSTSIDVIASGGLKDYDDIHALKKVQSSGIIGTISGKALYSNAIDPVKALQLCKYESV